MPSTQLSQPAAGTSANRVQPPAIKFFTYTSVALAVWIVLSTIYIVHAGYIAIPISDDWDRWVTYVDFHYTPHWFFREHVDHRLAVPNVLFALDHLLFRGRGWFLEISALCFQALTGLFLWRLAKKAYRQSMRQDHIERLLLASGIATLVFDAEQSLNFIQPFQIQFVMVYCAALAALFALLKAVESTSAAWLAISILAACLSTYSMANGILTWPLMLLAVVWFRMPWRWFATIAASGLFIGAVYFYDWHSFIVPAQLTRTERVERMIVFFLGHLGSPVLPLAFTRPTDFQCIAYAVIPGTVLAIAFTIGALMMLRQYLRRDGSEFNAPRATLMFFAAFLVGSSALISYGRSTGSMLEMFTWRYQTPSTLFWATMLAIAWPVLRRSPRVILSAGMCCAIFTGVAMHQRAVLGDTRARLNGQLLGELAIVDNVRDPDAWINLYHGPTIAQRAIDYFKAAHLTVFTEEWPYWPGTALTPRFVLDRNAASCEGRVDVPTPVSSPELPGWRMSGWAWEKRALLAPHYLLLVDENNRIAGVGLGGFSLPGSPSPRVPAATGFNGYVSGAPKSITVYLVEYDNHAVCSIGTLQLKKETSFDQFGASLPQSQPEITSAWVSDGYYKGLGGPGAPPSGGPVYGSFPDANTGSIRIGPFHLDGHTPIAIPVVTGPVNHGLSVIVRDAATKQVYAQMSPTPMRQSWWAWSPDLPTGHDLNIEIFAEDTGNGWGQWEALAWPHILK